MISYTGKYEVVQSLVSDDDATNLDLIKSFVKIGNRKLQAALGLYLSEEERDIVLYTDTITGTSGLAYYLPENFQSLTDFYTTIDTTQYPTDLIQDVELWRNISSSTTGSTSNYPQFTHIKNDRIEVWPIPSSDDTNTATMRYRSVEKELTQAVKCPDCEAVFIFEMDPSKPDDFDDSCPKCEVSYSEAWQKKYRKD